MINQETTGTRWAVAGGGMLGLATAWELIKRGQDVTLLDAGKEIGGLTSAWKLGDITWDRFYHVTLLSDTKLRKLLDELGLEKEIEWVQTRTGFFSNNKLYSMSNSLEFLLFPVLNLYQKFRLGSTIFWGSKIKDWRAMEQIPVETWLRRWSGNSTFEKIWLPLLKAKLGDAYKRASAAFIWSYIDRMYKARRSGMKREMFGYVPGGYQRIIATITSELQARGCRILSDAAVRKIEKIPTSTSVQVAYGPRGNETTEDFDRVVLTIPSQVISDACEQLDEDEHRKLNSVEYIGVVCTSLLLDRPLGGYYVTNITDSWVPLTGIIEMGSIVKPEKLNGKYLVYLPQYLMAEDERLLESDDSIHERCLATLEKMYPDFHRDQVQAIQTARAKYVMALPTLNYSQTRPSIVSSLPGVYLLNSSQIVKGNLNVNEVLELLEMELDATIWKDHLSIGQSTVGGHSVAVQFS
jgi:protoporphyrinogen oxidase